MLDYEGPINKLQYLHESIYTHALESNRNILHY
jgi:hypothetical protein